jgi:hypothetical protein
MLEGSGGNHGWSNTADGEPKQRQAGQSAQSRLWRSVCLAGGPDGSPLSEWQSGSSLPIPEDPNGLCAPSITSVADESWPARARNVRMRPNRPCTDGTAGKTRGVIHKPVTRNRRRCKRSHLWPNTTAWAHDCIAGRAIRKTRLKIALATLGILRVSEPSKAYTNNDCFAYGFGGPFLIGFISATGLERRAALLRRRRPGSGGNKANSC